MIEAEQALARVIEEIEQAEGERRFYDQQVALSTVAVIVYLTVFLTPWLVLAGLLFWMIRRAWTLRKRRAAKPGA